MNESLARWLALFVLPALAAGCLGKPDTKPADPAGGAFVHAAGKRIVGPDGEPVLLRGVNLGNWLVPEGYMFKLDTHTAAWQIELLTKELVGPEEARTFWERFRDAYITREDVVYLKRVGLNSVRVPFDFRLLTPEDSPDLWTGPGWALLDRVVSWCREAGLYVILDMHAAPCGQTGTNIDNSYGHPWLFESHNCQDRTVSVWRKIAERYRLEPTVIAYDLLNEPIPHFEGYETFKPQLEPLYRRIVAAIREIDPHHMIFLGGARWNTDFGVFASPFADNLVYTFHKYWMPPVQEEIAEYLNFREVHNVPVWLGESGENSDDWVLAFRRLLEENEIGWCFWPYKKMDAASSLRTFDPPTYWSEVQEFDKAPNSPPDKIKEGRPPLEHARQALRELIDNVGFANNRENRGYLEALGLEPAGDENPSDGN